MFSPQGGNLGREFGNLLLGAGNGGAAVALAPPAPNVVQQLGDLAVLLANVLARLAVARLQERLPHQLEPARLARAVFPLALHAEGPPAPVATRPERVVVVAHCCCMFVLVLPCGLCSVLISYMSPAPSLLESSSQGWWC